MKTKTPLIILAGFLGSGKTTLLRHIINNTDRKIAVLMNEFGEIGVDTETIQKENIAVKELLEGCVCCSLQGELEAAIAEIIAMYHPNLIIIETTGIAEADNLVLGIDQTIKNVTLDAVITIVDADALVRFPAMSGNFKTQIETADLLILNKIDLVSEKKAEELSILLKRVNPRAPIISTSYGKVDLDVLLSVEVEHNSHPFQLKQHNHHFQSFSLSSPSFSQKKLESSLKKLPSSVYRMKGHIKIATKIFLLNYVGGRWSLEEETGALKIVFIGDKVDKDKAEIEKLFKDNPS